MKKMVLAVCLVFVLSAIASAISFTSADIALRGYNKWENGKHTATAGDSNYETRVLVLSSSGTGWSARAEYVSSAAAFSKWNFQTDEKVFKLNVWGREYALSHYATPFTWVRQTNAAPKSDWKARLTATILGGETVFAIDNGTAPLYYTFYKRAFGDTTAGVAYRTNFLHTTAASVWAISKLPGVTVTGEVATDGKWDVAKEQTKLDLKYGLEAKLDMGLTLKGTYLAAPKQLTVEATQVMTDQLSRYYGKYYDNDGTKQIIGEVTFRAKNDQGITSVWGTNDNWYGIAPSNNWIKNTNWVAGATVTRNLEKDLILKLNGFYEFVPGKVKAMATINWNKADAAKATWDVALRGYYQVNNKFTIHPRVTVDKTWVKAGSYLDYVINRGRIVGAAWYEVNLEDNTKSQEKFELGWQLGL